jgi:hypothetical protein
MSGATIHQQLGGILLLFHNRGEAPPPPVSEIRITEDAEIRITEDGDERVTE